LIYKLSALSDDDFVITQELVDKINNNKNSTFKAKLYPKFANMKVRDFKKFLSPIRKVTSHQSPIPIETIDPFNESSDFESLPFYFTGIFPSGDNITVQYPADENGTLSFPITVYDVTEFCSSWAPAVTSAMSITLSRWSSSVVNLSVQFLLDCDILGDPCIERSPASAYEQFWRRYIPTTENWRDFSITPPSSQLNKAICDQFNVCYPGIENCRRELVMTGVCDSNNEEPGACPIYYLYNWKMIQASLLEVGAVTSSILVGQSFLTYEYGVYEEEVVTPLGFLDVTIIGWINDYWYIIPHLGLDFGLSCKLLYEPILSYAKFYHRKTDDVVELPEKNLSYFKFGGNIVCSSNVDNESRTGIMKIYKENSFIHSNGVLGVPI